MSFRLCLITLVSLSIGHALSAPNATSATRYKPTWDSLDKRPIPDWYDQAKVGIFIHWGVFSVPSFGTEWFWSVFISSQLIYSHNTMSDNTRVINNSINRHQWRTDKSKAFVDFMAHNYRTGFTYQDFAPMFTAEFYDPAQWADIFK